MFALLSAGGDVGASAGSFLIGRIADTISGTGVTSMLWLDNLTPEQTGLRVGLFMAAAFPVFCVIVNMLIKKKVDKCD